MIINSEQEMLDFGKEFAQKAKVIELVGDVGAGKTTFVRGLAKGLGIKKPITSPSFTISKSYALKNGGNLVHYDFYRLSDPGLMQNDLSETLKNPNNVIVVEWSDTVSDLLPPDRTIIKIDKTDNDLRKITIKNHPKITQKNLSQPTQNNSNKTLPKTASHKNIKNNNFQLYLDTSTPETILRLGDQEYRYNFDRDLAEKLLKFIHDKLTENHKTWQDLTEIVFMSGPGSFTGLRIGATIANTLSHELNIPLFDHLGQKHQIILPIYDRPANISKPRK